MIVLLVDLLDGIAATAIPRMNHDDADVGQATDPLDVFFLIVSILIFAGHFIPSKFTQLRQKSISVGVSNITGQAEHQCHFDITSGLHPG